MVNHPAIVLGDFNSHHTDWGYQVSDKAGEEVAQWAEQTNLTPIFNPKDRGTFSSARWRQDYNPDLTFASKSYEGTMNTTREVLTNFPRSQYRPVVVSTGIRIPNLKSNPKPRWNFRKANWEDYKKEIDKTCRRIPPTAQNIPRFTRLIFSSANKNIPRGFRQLFFMLDGTKLKLKNY